MTSCSPSLPKEDLLGGSQAAQAHGVHRDAVDATASAAQFVHLGGVGHVAQASLGACASDAARGGHRRTRGGHPPCPGGASR